MNLIIFVIIYLLISFVGGFYAYKRDKLWIFAAFLFADIYLAFALC